MFMTVLNGKNEKVRSKTKLYEVKRSCTKYDNSQENLEKKARKHQGLVKKLEKNSKWK